MSKLYPMFRTNYLDRWCLRYARKRIENGKAYYVCMALPPIIGIKTRVKIMDTLHPRKVLPAAFCRDEKKNRETRLRWIDTLLEYTGE